MVSKEGVQQQGIGLSSGESGERGWLQKRRVASTRAPEAPAHSSAAMCHQPCGHSATGEPVRSRLLPAPGQARRLPRGGQRPASIRRSCSFSAPWPRPSRSLQQLHSGRTG